MKTNKTIIYCILIILLLNIAAVFAEDFYRINAKYERGNINLIGIINISSDMPVDVFQADLNSIVTNYSAANNYFYSYNISIMNGNNIISQIPFDFSTETSYDTYNSSSGEWGGGTGEVTSFLFDLYVPYDASATKINICDKNNLCQTCNVNGQCTNIVVPPLKKLVAYYPFEGNATDASGNGNNGVVNGATFVSGKIGKAASFNGVNNYINFGSKFNISDQSTLSLWFNSNSFAGSKLLFSKQWQSNTAGFYVTYITSNNSILFQYSNGTVWKNIYFNKYTFNKAQWYHIALVRDNIAKKVSLYVNGVFSMSNSYHDNALNINSGNSLIGIYQTLAHYPFNGSIDEVKIWNYVLNDSEINAEYQRGSNCIDSDNGINYPVKGTLSYKNSSGNIQNFTDYCYVYNNINYNYTIEYYCTNTAYSSYGYLCQFGCLNGACKTNSNGKICNDQCSAGQKKCNRNYVYSCKDINYDGCLEWTYSSYCLAGCSNSACINAPCTDSDNGINYNVKGSIIFGNNTITTDFCSNKIIYEYYCKNSSTYLYNYTTCPINCLDGACSNQPPSCSETDNGYDPYNKGTLTYKNVSSTDYCASSNMLTEFYCSNDNKYSYNTTCYYGCLNGACTTS